jgi:tetratricopeptide (TPR) repeat protein
LPPPSLPTRTHRSLLSLGFTPRLAFSSDGSRIVANSAHGILSVWDAGADAIPSLREVARALRTTPSDQALLNKRAELYVKVGRWDKALAESSRVLEKNPNDARALRYRAEAKLGLSQAAEAAADLKRAQELAPNDPQLLPLSARVRHQFGDALMRSGKTALAQAEWQRARAAYEQLFRLEPDRADYAGQYADLLLAMTAGWAVLDPAAVQSANGVTLTKLPDGSILASGHNPDSDTYTLTATVGQQAIAAFKLEVLPHESLPMGGPGRNRWNGNFYLSEFTVNAAGRPVRWSRAEASFAEGAAGTYPNLASNAIDGDPNSGWSILPLSGQANYAIFALKTTLETTDKTELVIKLHFNKQPWPQHALGRFRISIASDRDPFRTDQLRRVLAAGSEKGWLNLAAVHALRRERDPALAALQKAPRLAETDNARDLLVHGWVHRQLGHPEEALPYLEKFSVWTDGHVSEDVLLPLVADAFSSLPAKTARGRKMLVQRAQSLARLNRAEEAVSAYSEAIAEGPAAVQNHIARGNVYAQLRKWPEAVADYNRAILPDTRDVDLIAKRAEAYFQSKDWEKAAADWTRALELKPNEILYLDRRALCYLWGLHRWDKALADCNALLKLSPENPWYLHNRAYTFDMLKQPDRASADYDRGVNLASENDRWWFLHNRAVHWARWGHWSKAAKDSAGVDVVRLGAWWERREHALVRMTGGDVAGYRQAADVLFKQLPGKRNADESIWLARVTLLDPAPLAEIKKKRLLEVAQYADDYSKPRLAGVIHLRAGRFKEAVDLLRDIDGAPDYQYPAAIARQRMGQFDQARNLLNQANRRMDERQSTTKGQGVPESMWWGDWALRLCWRREAEKVIIKEGIEELTRALSTKPKDAGLLRERGWRLARTGEWQKAIADLTLVKDLKAADADLWKELALGYAAMNQPEKAAAAFDSALQLTAQPRRAWYGERGIDDLVADQDAVFEQVIKLRPRDATLWIARCRHFAYAGQWKEAAVASARATELNPGDIWNWFCDSALRLQLGDMEGYRRDCEELMQRFGDTKDGPPADLVAKACLLVPRLLPNTKPALQLAQRAITGTEKHEAFRWFQLDKGLADYRAELFAASVEQLQKMTPKPDGGPEDATAFIIMAMAHHRLRRPTEAAAALAKADAILKQRLPTGRSAKWLVPQIAVGLSRGRRPLR